MKIHSERVLSLAEELNSLLPLGPGEERYETPEYVQWMSTTADPHHNVVQRLRINADRLSQTIDQTRARFASRNRHQATWEVSSGATPRDLAKRLVAFGMSPDHPEPLAVGMVRAEPLLMQPSGIVTRRIETLDEFIACHEILSRCFGAPKEDEPQRQFELLQANPQKTRWIALLKGKPVGTADAIHLEFATVLSGGATLAEYRGRGAYRALLAARSREAVRRGVPTLVTQAGSMSRPILRRLGFAQVSQIHIFVDCF